MVFQNVSSLALTKICGHIKTKLNGELLFSYGFQHKIANFEEQIVFIKKL